MSSKKLKMLPVEYLWDGLVLNDDLFSYGGKVMLLPKGETVTKAKLNKLIGFYGENKNVMVYEDTYLEIMMDAHTPQDVRQRATEQGAGYTRLHQNLGNLFQRTDYEGWLSNERMKPLIKEVASKLNHFDPATILSCINFPRPMDEGLQRHSLNVAFLNGFICRRRKCIRWFWRDSSMISARR